MSNSPLIYAELLSNIRQVSVIAALSTPCTASTKVEISTNGKHFVLSHDDVTTSLDLPSEVSIRSQLQVPKIGATELSWRVPLANQAARTAIDDAHSNEAPWSASSIPIDCEFQCRHCNVLVIKKGSIQTWKDLPSENWAEMMDFWHCHKPDVPHSHGSSDQTSTPDKGYGANIKFSASKGNGFVDLATFLVSDEDCIGIQIATSPQPNPPTKIRKYQSIKCSSCSQYLGYNDLQAEGIRLYKWRLTLSSLPSPPITATRSPDRFPITTKPSLASIISAQLLSIVHSQCISRIIILPHPQEALITPINADDNTNDENIPSEINNENEVQALSLWIFTPALRFSSTVPFPFPSVFSRTSATSSPSLSTRDHAHLATKIFFHPLTPSQLATETLPPNTEELFLPLETIRELYLVLRESGDVLPSSGRKFGGWEVGLLERWEGVHE